jgi:hypothetical protein
MSIERIITSTIDRHTRDSFAYTMKPLFLHFQRRSDFDKVFKFLSHKKKRGRKPKEPSFHFLYCDLIDAIIENDEVAIKSHVKNYKKAKQ